MTMYVQHGYGKGDKVQRLLQEGNASGVVLSPADETADNLAATAASARGFGAAVLLDPQMYVSTIPGGAARRHEDNSLDFSQVRWSAGTELVHTHVEQVLNLNHRVGTTAVIAPAPLQTAFLDPWAPVAIQYARETMRFADRPTYVSVVVEESALAEWTPIAQWLNEVTTLDCEGFYIVIARSDRPYPQLWNPALLMNLLRIVYRLGVLNRYTILWGFTDIAGLLSLATGATAFGCGWFYSLRNFTSGKWVPKTGGGVPTARVLSSGLLSPIEALGEGGPIARSSIGEYAFPARELRSRLSNGEQVPVGEARLQHLQVLGGMAADLGGGGPALKSSDVWRLVERVDGLLAAAQETLAEAERLGIALATRYRTGVNQLRQALNGFVEIEGLA